MLYSDVQLDTALQNPALGIDQTVVDRQAGIAGIEFIDLDFFIPRFQHHKSIVL